MSEFVFFNADFCPFAQRTWIALEEKQVPYNTVWINYLNRSLPDTKKFLNVSPSATVPAGVHDGFELHDSLPMNYYLEEAFPETKPLLPEDAAARFRVRSFLIKHEPIIGAFYRYLMCEGATDEQKEACRDALVEVCRGLADDLQLPYAFGEQFTLADTAFFPFLERINVLLPRYRGFTFPSDPSFARLKEWYQKCAARPSVMKTMRDRCEGSMAVLPYGAKNRNEFLIEVYLPYARNKVGESRKLLADAPPGVRSLPEDF